MARFDYTKAEKAFARNALRHHKDKVIEAIRSQIVDNLPTELPSVRTRKDAIKKLKRRLKHLNQLDNKIYKDLETSEEEINKWRKDVEKLSLEEWQKIHVTRLRTYAMMQALKGELKKMLEEESNDQINQERTTHVNKRHKVKHDWWPV